MIEHAIVGGRPATVAYLTSSFELTDPIKASLVKVLFEDGDMIMLAGPAENPQK